MTCSLKTYCLALLAACAVGVTLVSVASAAVEHEFHSDGPKTIHTGSNVWTEKIAIGSAGTVECPFGTFESTSTGAQVSAGTYKSDTLTVTSLHSGCTFAGKSATVKMNHCAYVLDSDTTAGNSDGGEHANMQIECAEGNQIEIDTSVCTITIGAQTINHAVRYENDTGNSVNVIVTAKKIITGKAKTTESQTGCLLVPTGAIGTMTGTFTFACYKDEGEDVAFGTTATTAELFVGEGAWTECKVS